MRNPAYVHFTAKKDCHMIPIEPLPQPTEGMTRDNLIQEETIIFKFHSTITKSP